MSATSANGTIIVFQDREWFGDPRLGAFTMSVDSKRVGKVILHGECACQVVPGVHSVRIRQWWYRSPVVNVNVASGMTTRLRGDIPLSLSFLKRMAKFALSPSSCLVLEPAGVTTDQTRVSASRRVSEQGRRAALGNTVASIVGFVIVLIGAIKTAPVLIVLGLLLVVGGTALALRRILSARKGMSSSNPSQ
jgi:hypothetical protein